MTITEEFAELITEIGSTPLIHEDIEATRYLLLDYIGCASNGSLTDSARVGQVWASRLGAVGTSQPVIGNGVMMSGLQAGMVNAIASHSIEFDDVHNAASLHPAVVIFPSVFAAQSITKSSDQEVLVAAVKGYEAMCRLGRSVYPPGHYARNYHPTSTVGVFGAVAAAGSLFNLDKNQLVNAFGIAATMSAGSMQFLVDGSWTKRLHPALSMRNGVEAAMLASCGFVGGRDGIGGPKGFLHSFSLDPREKYLLEDWDTRPHEVRNTSIKAHTCCRYKQGPIDIILKICRDEKLLPSDVTKIIIGLPTLGMEIVGEPHDQKIRPNSVVDAQFSMPFGAAVAILFKKAGLDEYAESSLNNPEIRRIMALTHCETDPEIDRYFPHEWRAWVRIETIDGKSYRSVINNPKGDPQNPLTAAELREKFQQLTKDLWSPDKQDEVAKCCSRFGADGSFDDLMQVLTVQ